MRWWNRKRRADKLLEIREVIEDNVSVERMEKGVKNQRDRFNGYGLYAKEVRKRWGNG